MVNASIIIIIIIQYKYLQIHNLLNHCLQLFTKSHAEVQSVILDMICQSLEYKVNYSLLDAKNGFIEFVLKQLELIETGTVR